MGGGWEEGFMTLFDRGCEERKPGTAGEERVKLYVFYNHSSFRTSVVVSTLFTSFPWYITNYILL